jgi:hypothetical protein
LKVLQFKQVGLSKDLNDPLELGSVEIPKGEHWSVSVDKSVIGCNDKLYAIQCGVKLPLLSATPCQQEHIITRRSCVNSISNDETSYISLTIVDKSTISAFTIYYQDVVDEVTENIDIFEFDGGDIDDLSATAFGFNLGVEITAYGIILFFNQEYVGKTASITTLTDVYLLNNAFSRNYSPTVTVGMSFSSIGCYRLAFYKKQTNGELKLSAISGTIKVLSFKPKNTKIIEYYENGLYSRHRVDMVYDAPDFVIEEDEKVLSSGKLSNSNVIIRNQATFRAGLYNQSNHLELIKVLKSGAKVDGENVLMRGGYNIIGETMNQEYMGSGSLSLIDKDVINLNSCGTDISQGSTVRYQINEEERERKVITTIL